MTLSKFHEMPTRMVTAAIMIASQSVVNIVRTGLCRDVLDGSGERELHRMVSSRVSG